MPCFMRGAGRGEAARGFGAVGRRAPVRSAGRSRLRVSSNIRARWPPLSEARACLHLRPRVSFPCPGFKEQIYDVYRYLPPATQVVLISATLPHEILEMTNKFMTDPIRILVKR